MTCAQCPLHSCRGACQGDCCQGDYSPVLPVQGGCHLLLKAFVHILHNASYDLLQPQILSKSLLGFSYIRIPQSPHWCARSGLMLSACEKSNLVIASSCLAMGGPRCSPIAFYTALCLGGNTCTQPPHCGAGSGCSRGQHCGWSQGLHCQGAPSPEDAGRRHAPGRRPGSSGWVADRLSSTYARANLVQSVPSA